MNTEIQLNTNHCWKFYNKNKNVKGAYFHNSAYSGKKTTSHKNYNRNSTDLEKIF